MLKGTPQEKRNNAWHTKHTKKKASDSAHRLFRLSERKSGAVSYSKADKLFRKALEREKQSSTKKVSLWRKVKFYFMFLRIKFKEVARKIFKSNTIANA